MASSLRLKLFCWVSALQYGVSPVVNTVPTTVSKCTVCILRRTSSVYCTAAAAAAAVEQAAARERVRAKNMQSGVSIQIILEGFLLCFVLRVSDIFLRSKPLLMY